MGSPSKGSILKQKKEEDFWEDKSVTDELDIALFLQNLNDEEKEVLDPHDWPEDNLSQNSWELQNQDRPQPPFIFFDNNVDLPWEEDSMAKSFAYKDSINTEQDEHHQWDFIAIREDRRTEEEEDPTILLLQEIEEILLEQV